MNRIIVVSILLFLAYSQPSFSENCSEIIKLSRIYDSTIVDKETFSEEANSFCSNQSGDSGSTNGIDFGVSFPVLSGSFGLNSSNSKSVSKKVCGNASGTATSDSAYRRYLQNINADAYSAYKECIKISNAFKFRNIAMTEDKFLITAHFDPADTTPNATLGYQFTAGNNCKWGNKSKTTVKIESGGQAALECTRSKTDKKEYITVYRTTGNDSIQIMWPKYKDGVPVDLIANLEKKINSAHHRVDSLDSIIARDGEKIVINGLISSPKGLNRGSCELIDSAASKGHLNCPAGKAVFGGKNDDDDSVDMLWCCGLN